MNKEFLRKNRDSERKRGSEGKQKFPQKKEKKEMQKIRNALLIERMKIS